MEFAGVSGDRLQTSHIAFNRFRIIGNINRENFSCSLETVAKDVTVDVIEKLIMGRLWKHEMEKFLGSDNSA